MKKKYLIVFENMSIGGIEKSIISLLSILDYSKVDVDLFLLQEFGDFLEQIPSEVNIIDSQIPNNFFLSIIDSLKSLESLELKLKRIGYSAIRSFEKKGILKKGILRKYISNKLLFSQKKKYDVAIAYTDWQFDFVINKTNAKHKYFYIHVNYEESYKNLQMDTSLFSKCTGILTVSKDSAESIIKNFPECKKKVHIINNVISRELIMKMALEKIELDDFDGTRILTVCRLSHEKGIDIAVLACKELIDNNYNVRWYVIGEGNEYDNLKSLIKEYNLEKNFFLLGKKANPYPYFKKANIYVQPSLHEGFGLTIAEAKILQKPIIVSNITVFSEQIENNVEGLVSQCNAYSFYKNITLLINDTKLQLKLAKNLHNVFYDNEKVLYDFYNL